MRSTRASAAWAALAVTTSLLGVTLVSAQTQTTAATSGANLSTTAVQTKSTFALGGVIFGKDPAIVGGAYHNSANAGPCRGGNRANESTAHANPNLSC